MLEIMGPFGEDRLLGKRFQSAGNQGVPWPYL
jgi:hypothetical protein